MRGTSVCVPLDVRAYCAQAAVHPMCEGMLAGAHAALLRNREALRCDARQRASRCTCDACICWAWWSTRGGCPQGYSCRAECARHSS